MNSFYFRIIMELSCHAASPWVQRSNMKEKHVSFLKKKFQRELGYLEGVNRA